MPKPTLEFNLNVLCELAFVVIKAIVIPQRREVITMDDDLHAPRLMPEAARASHALNKSHFQ